MKKLLAALLRSNAVGSLGRDVRVELVDLSRSGCLLISPVMIPAGTIGILTLEIDGELYADDVRVARCLKVPGTGECHDVGVEFLELRPPRRLTVADVAMEENKWRPRTHAYERDAQTIDLGRLQWPLPTREARLA